MPVSEPQNLPHRAALVLAAVLMVSGAGPVQADDGQAAESADPGFRVVELFTSHGCSSCPPADMLLGQLIQDNPELVALEYHVDYWDSLVSGGSNWVDPFSKPDWTQRQRAYYMEALQGRPGVYTPQMVINGRYATVGSDVRRVTDALDDAQTAAASVSIRRDGDQLELRVQALDDSASGAGIYLARYRMQEMTDVTAGENRHLMLTNYHVVDSLEELGRLAGKELITLSVPAAPAGQGCSVIVSAPGIGPVLGAGNCP